MSNDVLRSLLTAFISGDREGAVSAATQALDGYIHDFIFPDDTSPAGDVYGDEIIPADPMGGIDDIEDVELPLDDELPLDGDTLPADDTGLGSDLDADLGADLGGDLDFADDTLPFESAAIDDDLNLEVPGGDDDDAMIAAIGDEVGLTGDDVTGVSELPADGEGELPATGTADLVGVEVDAEQSDEVVSAVKVIYSDDTDFTFFTFTRDAEQVVSLINKLNGGEEELDMDPESLAGMLGESFVLL